MKNLLNKAIACAIVMTTCFNCSVEPIENNQFEMPLKASLETEEIQVSQDIQDPCSGQDPQARITNNGTTTVTLEIANMEGTILHTVADLAPGAVSGYLTFAPDDIIFNVSKDAINVMDEKVSHNMSTCMSFDMEVGADNNLVPSNPINL